MVVVVVTVAPYKAFTIPKANGDTWFRAARVPYGTFLVRKVTYLLSALGENFRAP